MDALFTHHHLRLSIICLLGALSSGCGAAMMSIAGTGASLATSYALNGIVHRTFNQPSTSVEKAAILALNNMSIRTETPVLDTKTNQNIEKIIIGKAGNRWIQINLESITPTLTKMEVVAKVQSIFVDKATAEEVIEQTAMHLNANRSLSKLTQ